LERLRDTRWTAEKSIRALPVPEAVDILSREMERARRDKRDVTVSGSFALTQYALQKNLLKPEEPKVEAPKKEELRAPAKDETAPPASPSEDRPLVATRDEPEAKKPAAAPTPPPAAKTPERPPARTSDLKKAASSVGTEETISWNSLVSDGDKKPTQAAEKTAAPPPGNMPDTSETMSWKDLVGSGTAEKAKTAVKEQAMVSAKPGSYGGGGGFGMTGYGAGFGGMGSLGMPPARPPTVSKPVEKPAESADQKAEKAVQDGETVSWKDLIE
jgi:hypothetical protein